MQAILNLTRHSIGNQRNCSSRQSEFVDRRLEPRTTTRAAAFCARWRRVTLWSAADHSCCSIASNWVFAVVIYSRRLQSWGIYIYWLTYFWVGWARRLWHSGTVRRGRESRAGWWRSCRRLLSECRSAHRRSATAVTTSAPERSRAALHATKHYTINSQITCDAKYSCWKYLMFSRGLRSL